MAENYLIAVLAISITFNVMIILLQLLTGIGKDALQRFLWKKKHRRGGYAYSLMATRDGIITEVFAPVEDGKFKWNKQDYVREPKLMKNYRGIPANFHREGIPAPIDPWSDAVADFILSCREMDTVMNSQKEFNFLEWIKENKGLIIIGVIVIVGICALSAYFGYNNYQMLRDGTAKVASAVVSAK